MRKVEVQNTYLVEIYSVITQIAEQRSVEAGGD